MDRHFYLSASDTAPVKPTGSSGYPTNGNPATGIPATIIGAHWYHMITEEIRAVIVAGGLEPSADSLTQLRDAIAAMIAAAGGVADASTTVKGLIEIATSGEALAGSSGLLAITPVTLKAYVDNALSAADLPRASCNFDGTAAVGAITPRSGSGISSIVKNATGDYTVTFSAAFADTGYVLLGTAGNTSSSLLLISAFPINATSARIFVTGGSNTKADAEWVMLRVYGALAA